MNEWIIEESSYFASRYKRFRKKHPNETAAMMNNLDTYIRALNKGVKPALLQAGFIHREPLGVIALDQRGASGSPKQTRLYIYTYEVRNTVYLITIGDKISQKRDIDDCRNFVKALRKESQENGKTV